MNKTPLREGEIVILHPHECRNPMFAGCAMVVTEPKPWGAQGYVQCTGENGKPDGQAYYRATWKEIDRTGGMSQWIVTHQEPQEGPVKPSQTPADASEAQTP